ncbi:MAG: cell envelope integrity protein TolA [Candidatus Kariarchaeaceae archaeon]
MELEQSIGSGWRNSPVRAYIIISAALSIFIIDIIMRLTGVLLTFSGISVQSVSFIFILAGVIYWLAINYLWTMEVVYDESEREDLEEARAQAEKEAIQRAEEKRAWVEKETRQKTEEDAALKVAEETRLQAEVELKLRERIEIFRKVVKRTAKLKMEQLSTMLQMEENDLLMWLYNLPEEFGFIINEDIVEFDVVDIDASIDALITSFEQMETAKQGKLE